MPGREKVISAFERCFCEENEHCPGCYQEGPGFGLACRNALCLDVLDLLKEQEKIVRCKDCKYYNVACCSAGFGWCDRYNCGQSDDWFCAGGKRRWDDA